MLDLFKSQARREREAIRDAVIEAIVQSESAAKAEIHLLETAVDPPDQAKAMIRLVNVLLGCERTEKDVAIWQARADAAEGARPSARRARRQPGHPARRLRRSPVASRRQGLARRVDSLRRVRGAPRPPRRPPRRRAVAGPVPRAHALREVPPRARAGARRRRGAREHAAPDVDDGLRVVDVAARFLSRDAAQHRRADRERRGQARRLDAEQLHEPGQPCSAGPASGSRPRLRRAPRASAARRCTRARARRRRGPANSGGCRWRTPPARAGSTV